MLSSRLGAATPAYLRAMKMAEVQRLVNKALKKTDGEISIPGDLAGRVQRQIEGSALSWDKAIYLLAEGNDDPGARNHNAGPTITLNLNRCLYSSLINSEITVKRGESLIPPLARARLNLSRLSWVCYNRAGRNPSIIHPNHSEGVQ